MLYEPGPSAGSRKSEFRQLVIDGITQLEQGGGGIGNGIIRRYRIGSSVFGEDFPADGAEVGQDVEFSRIFCQGMRDEAVFRQERDFAAGRRLDYREDGGGNEPDIADVNAVPPFFLERKGLFSLNQVHAAQMVDSPIGLTAAGSGHIPQEGGAVAAFQFIAGGSGSRPGERVPGFKDVFPVLGDVDFPACAGVFFRHAGDEFDGPYFCQLAFGKFRIFSLHQDGLPLNGAGGCRFNQSVRREFGLDGCAEQEGGIQH